jgi:small neutral amino acid transporter SnatA (MarC family)
VPLAIPAIAGPSALATVMLMASRSPDQLGMLVVAITAAMVVMVIVLALSDPIQRLVGDQGVLAMTRLMGLVLTALSIEMLVSGLGSVVDQFLKR